MEEVSSFNHWGKSSEEILKEHFPLHRCCRDGDVEQLSLLIKESPHNIFTEDSFYGWTPAHWAAYFGKLACLRKVVMNETIGVDCDIYTREFHQTPAHLGAFGGHPHLLHWLILSGADKNSQDYLGETPVHKAARTGSMECVSLLASHGAQLGIKNKTNHTASELAKERGFLECSRYLGLAEQRQAQQDLALKQTYAVTIPGATEPGHDEMEMEECCPTAGGVIPPGAVASSEGDVLLYNGVGKNCVPIAGRKRGREDNEEETIKRIRTGGNVSDAISRSQNFSCTNGFSWPLDNNNMVGTAYDPPQRVSSSLNVSRPSPPRKCLAFMGHYI
ncbi:ankyrin repeat domain-containing protein 65-like isoform X2 [Lineus longissimus]|uniref:ankyrin repeat domain-containing protein 65-like isoform X2 n=1 Tax=Lineus longissimus TaxID=88925 RepID=UPI00315D8AC4